MEYIYTSFVFVISIIEASLFYQVICRRKLAEVKYTFFIPIIALYFVEILCVGMQIRGLPQNIIIMLLYYLVGVIFTETGCIENIKFWLLCLLLSSAVEQIVYQVVWSRFFTQVQGYGAGSVFTCVSVTLILIFFNKIFSKKVDDDIDSFSAKIFWVLTPIACAIILGISYIAYMMEQVDSEEQRTLTLCILLVAILGIGIVIIIIVRILQQKESFRIEAEMENLYNQQQRTYFTLMLDKENETKRFRHDILNHLLCMQDILKQKHYRDAEAYLDSVLKELNTIREMQYDVGNEVVNVLLNFYLIPIREHCNISIEGYLGKLECVSQMDLCTIVSNLLKNAVEAVETGGNIRVNIIRKEKYVQIDITNTYKSNPEMRETDRLETTKADKENHGYGIDNAKKAVFKYHGEFQYYMEENWFKVEIVLPI